MSSSLSEEKEDSAASVEQYVHEPSAHVHASGVSTETTVVHDDVKAAPYHPKKMRIKKYQEQDSKISSPERLFRETQQQQQQQQQQQFASVALMQNQGMNINPRIAEPQQRHEVARSQSSEQLTDTRELLQQNLILRQKLKFLEQEHLKSLIQLQMPQLFHGPPQAAQARPLQDLEQNTPSAAQLQYQALLQQNVLLRQQLQQMHLQSSVQNNNRQTQSVSHSSIRSQINPLEMGISSFPKLPTAPSQERQNALLLQQLKVHPHPLHRTAHNGSLISEQQDIHHREANLEQRNHAFQQQAQSNQLEQQPKSGSADPNTQQDMNNTDPNSPIKLLTNAQNQVPTTTAQNALLLHHLKARPVLEDTHPQDEEHHPSTAQLVYNSPRRSKAQHRQKFQNLGREKTLGEYNTDIRTTTNVQEDHEPPLLAQLQSQSQDGLQQSSVYLRQQQLLLQAQLQQQRRQLMGAGLWDSPSYSFSNPFLPYSDAARDLSGELVRANLYGNTLSPFYANLLNNVGRLQSNDSLNGNLTSLGAEDPFLNVGRFSSLDSLASGIRPSSSLPFSDNPTGYSNVGRLSTGDLLRSYSDVYRMPTFDLLPNALTRESLPNQIAHSENDATNTVQPQLPIPTHTSNPDQNIPRSTPPSRLSSKRKIYDSKTEEEDDEEDSDEDVMDLTLTGAGKRRFKSFHKDQWNERLEELIAYKQVHGHCLVPHTYPENPFLARWVKRQRRQFKLMKEGQRSTMTDGRIALLNDVGFVWDSHEINWNEKYLELIEYKIRHGHCLVPSGYKKNPQLATWVKCQRRQYRLFMDGKPSSMTITRVQELNKVGFDWEVRPR